MKKILGIKKGMTRIFREDKAVPVTIIDAGNCVVAFKDEKGIELGIGKVRGNKALKGKYSKLGYVPAFREYFSGDFEMNVGDAVKPEDFSSGLKVSIGGTSKGKGFAGVVKRWGFHGGPKTHGQSDKHRSPGSIGAGTTPGRVYKGTKMSGRMGGDQITLNNREIVDVVDSYLLVSGPVPGKIGSFVTIVEK